LTRPDDEILDRNHKRLRKLQYDFTDGIIMYGHVYLAVIYLVCPITVIVAFNAIDSKLSLPPERKVELEN
jgi:hypothetical protein